MENEDRHSVGLYECKCLCVMPLLLFLIIKVKTHLYLKPMRVTLTHIHLNQARMNRCIFYTCAPLLSYYPKKTLA